MSLSERAEGGLPWGWRDWAVLALLGLGAAFALHWYWNTAPNLWSDATMHIYRAFEVDRSIGLGILYPRLATDFNFTYGAPLLQYRPPLVHYMIPALHWARLGWIDSAKLTASIALLLAGIGMYVYARWLFKDRRAALVSGAAYLLAPYLIYDIQVRGAISEAAALAVLPWLFWAMHHTLRNEGHLWPWLAALFTALLVLAHNIIALFAVPVLLFYLCLLAWRGRTWRQVPAVLAALAAGLGMSAFYWIPALLERGYAQIEANMLNRPIETFLSPASEWIQRQLAFDYWGLLQARLSLWQAVLAVVAMLALVVTAITTTRGSSRSGLGSWQERDFGMALLAGITASVMVLQLDASLLFWNSLPLVRYIQFPSRLLGTAAFCIALLAGFLLTLEIPRPEDPRPGQSWPQPYLVRISGWFVAVGLLAVFLYAGAAKAPPKFSPADGLSEDAVSLEALSERGRSYFTLFSNFLPTTVKVDPTALPNPRPSPDASLAPMTYVPNLAVKGDQPFRLNLQVQSAQPFTLRLHRFFFPGWQVYAAGKPVTTAPTGTMGLITADLPSGEYPVVAEFGPTPVRSVADIISVISLAVWIALGVAIRRARPILIGLAAALLLVTVLAVTRFGPAQLLAAARGGASRHPISVAANFQDEIRLLGYDLPKQTWHAGDDLPLRLYWLAQRTPAADYKVFVHLVKPDDSGTVAQSDSVPVLGYSPTTRWDPGEVIPDDHPVHLDENIPPGKYLLLIGLYRPETLSNLPVSGAAQVWPGDRVVLTEIEVQNPGP